MQLDLYAAAAGLLVGLTVGLTGMGGGALMTPLLVLLFKSSRWPRCPATWSPR
jgi:uncharacterized membrane protein YfcA